MVKFSVIVPLIPEHDTELRDLLRYLKSQELYLNELIICRSETSKKDSLRVLKRYKKWCHELEFNLKLELNFIHEQAYDGTNRNRGIENAISDYLVFLDADDRYSANMFYVLSKVFTDTNCDAILHDYSLDEISIVCGEPSEKNLVWLQYSEELSSLNFDEPIRKQSSSDIPQIHHAHLSVKKYPDQEKFLDIFPGADTEYCKRLLKNGKKVIFVDQKLSFWNRKRSVRYKIRLAKKKFGLKK